MASYTSIFAGFARKFTAFKKKNPKLRHYVPHALTKFVFRSAYWRNRLRNVFIDRKHESNCVNVFHCCIQKTGSVWINTLMSDPVVYKYSGLSVFNFDGQKRKRQTDKIEYINYPFPKKSIVSAMKISYENYTSDVPKNIGENRVFFVMRDPRELVVSWYFSTKENHLGARNSGMIENREKLNALSERDGMMFSIDHFVSTGKFDLLDSWCGLLDNEEIMIVKYEELISGGYQVFHELFEFLDIRLPADELKNLVGDYSFESMTGRSIGNEDTRSHLRGGGANSWEKYFDAETLTYFDEKSSGLAEKLGY